MVDVVVEVELVGKVVILLVSFLHVQHQLAVHQLVLPMVLALQIGLVSELLLVLLALLLLLLFFLCLVEWHLGSLLEKVVVEQVVQSFIQITR